VERKKRRKTGVIRKTRSGTLKHASWRSEKLLIDQKKKQTGKENRTHQRRNRSIEKIKKKKKKESKNQKTRLAHSLDPVMKVGFGERKRATTLNGHTN